MTSCQTIRAQNNILSIILFRYVFIEKFILTNKNFYTSIIFVNNNSSEFNLYSKKYLLWYRKEIDAININYYQRKIISRYKRSLQFANYLLYTIIFKIIKNLFWMKFTVMVCVFFFVCLPDCDQKQELRSSRSQEVVDMRLVYTW